MPLPLAGALIRASDLAAIFPVGVDAWAPYVPTLVQSGAVPKTTNLGRYMKVGRKVTAEVNLSVTAGAGPVAANEVRVGLPVSAAATAATPAGYGYLYDASTGLAYKFVALLDNVNYVTLIATSTTTAGRLGADTFTAALAADDSVNAILEYESAS